MPQHRGYIYDILEKFQEGCIKTLSAFGETGGWEVKVYSMHKYIPLFVAPRGLAFH